MAIDEIFPNPTVSQVIFQIKFPNLFYIENKIGDFQMEIIKEFPNSSLLYRKQIVFADMGPDIKLSEIEGDIEKETGQKIWRFKSLKNVELNVLNNSLDISSGYHKTYNIEGGDKFRDVIIFVVDAFLRITKIPIINRIGLRYINECPIPSKDNATFKSYYNSIFPLDRFDLTNTNVMNFKTIVKKNGHYLGYVESLQKHKDTDEYFLILDLDAYSENVPSDNYLASTDRLHDIISEEFCNSIKEPVYKYMRSKERR